MELSRLDGRIVEQDENYRNIKARVDMAQKTGRTAGQDGRGSSAFYFICSLTPGRIFFPDPCPGSRRQYDLSDSFVLSAQQRQE